METTQNFDWGKIEWLYQPQKSSRDIMYIGISTIWPRAIQPKHVHCGDEQLMYIISGYGDQLIGEELSKIEPGKIFHVSPGSTHETINLSDEPIIKLLISVPVSFLCKDALQFDNLHNNTYFAEKKTQVSLLPAIEKLNKHLIAPLKMPVAFFDANHTLLLRNCEYPAYCRTKCNVDKDIDNCILYSYKDNHVPPYYKDATAYVCLHGISLYNLGIVYENELLGYIKAGHVRVGNGDIQTDNDLPYEVPKSTVNGIVQIMHSLVKEICEFYIFEEMHMEIQKYEGDITNQEIQKNILMESLQNTQKEIFNLQIGQHFLFNTLSTIAGMAIKEQAFLTYNAISDLAQLFRYTLRTTSLFVELKEELEYLKNYTNLQKLRFGNRLKVNYIVTPSLLKERVPFNFIQPIVENCFKHAFKNTTNKMEINIDVARTNDFIKISVQDNGGGMNDESYAALKSLIRSPGDTGGTSIVSQKLTALYGEQHSFEVISSSDGTIVELLLPCSIQEQANKDGK